MFESAATPEPTRPAVWPLQKLPRQGSPTASRHYQPSARLTRMRRYFKDSNMKIKTSVLTGPALDWAVAKCEIGDPVGSFLDGVVPHPNYADFHPSTDWSQGGPILEHERISVWWHAEYDQWCAADQKWMAADTESEEFLQMGEAVRGPTPLEAAMRCYVASKLGDEVEIPDELISGEISPNKES